jgi:hypothetical protein
MFWVSNIKVSGWTVCAPGTKIFLYLEWREKSKGTVKWKQEAYFLQPRAAPLVPETKGLRLVSVFPRAFSSCVHSLRGRKVGTAAHVMASNVVCQALRLFLQPSLSECWALPLPSTVNWNAFKIFASASNGYASFRFCSKFQQIYLQKMIPFLRTSFEMRLYQQIHM